MEGVSRAESETAPAWWRGVRAVERCGRGLEYDTEPAGTERAVWMEHVVGGAYGVGVASHGRSPSWAERVV